MLPKIIILPGNGNSDIATSHWYAWLKNELQKLGLEYHEYTDRGHFGSEYKNEAKFPELLAVMKRKLFY